MTGRARSLLAVLLERLGDMSAGLVVLTVVPLVLLQMPNLIAAAAPAMLASLHAGTGAGGHAGPGTGAELMRMAGLALPAMLLVSPPAAVAARRGGTWPVLLGGLALIGLADAGGNLVGIRPGAIVSTVSRGLSVLAGGAVGGGAGGGTASGSVTGLVVGVALDRVAHGFGAGLAAAGTLALLWERSRRARRVLACLWAAAAACTLVTAVPLIWPQLSGSGWRVLLQPYPQLTGAALAATALYVVLMRGKPAAGSQAARAPAARRPGGPAKGARDPGGHAPGGRGGGQRAPAERAQVAMLSVPVAGLCGLTVGSTFGWPARTQLVAGILAAVVLAALAITLSRDAVTGGGLCFPLVALAAGLVAAPSAGAVESLRTLSRVPVTSTAPAHGLLASVAGVVSWPPVTVAAAAALAGAVAGGAAALSGRWLAAAPALAVMTGLAVAGSGLVLFNFDSHTGARTLAIAFGLLAGGLALAIAPALGEAPAGGALAGLPVLLAGALAGYLIAGAIRLGLLPGGAADGAVGGTGVRPTAGAGSPAGAATAVIHALRGAARTWELAAAAVAAAAVLGVFLVGRARRATVRARRAG